MRQIFANMHPNLWLNELFKEATGLSFQLGDAWDVANGSASAPKAEPNWGQKELIMRADQRRSLHRTILTAAVLLLSASAVAAQTTYYGPGGDYLGQGTWRRNTATFYDAKGNFVGTSSTVGRSTSFFGRDGAFQGTLSRTGDSTNFYDRAGRYQGSVTTVPPPGSVGTRSKRRR